MKPRKLYEDGHWNLFIDHTGTMILVDKLNDFRIIKPEYENLNKYVIPRGILQLIERYCNEKSYVAAQCVFKPKGEKK
jgi:hypothetical protein